MHLSNMGWFKDGGVSITGTLGSAQALAASYPAIAA
jgi:hypothetical protein